MKHPYHAGDHWWLFAAMVAVMTALSACSGKDEQARRDSVEEARAKRCGDAANAVVSANGIGPARLGMRVSEVANLCAVTDTVLPALAMDSATVSSVRIGQSTAFLLISPDSTIRGFVVTDTGFRTDRGVGVGSRIRTLRFAYGRVCAVDRNGEAVLAVAGLDGLTFSFDPSSLPATVYRTRILGSELRTDAADDLPVREVRIGYFKSPCREQRLAAGLKRLTRDAMGRSG